MYAVRNTYGRGDGGKPPNPPSRPVRLVRLPARPGGHTVFVPVVGFSA